MKTMYTIKRYSALMACLLFFTCTNEPVEHELILDSVIERDRGISTVPLEESIIFFESLNTERLGQSGDSFSLNIDLKSLEQVTLSNTDAKLNIANATTKFENVETSVLQINIGGKL